MTMRSWLRNVFSRPAARPIRKAPSRFRPRLDILEDRTVPANITVNTFADLVAADGLTSLREAIAQAATSPGADTIKLPAGEYDLSLGQLTINDASGAVTIKGIDGVATIDAQGASRVIEIAAGSTAAFRDLTLTGGHGVGYVDYDHNPVVVFHLGGGIFNAGTLTLQGCTVSGNSGIVALGGGIFNSGTLTLQGSTVSGNSADSGAADDRGGGIYNNGGTL